MLNNDKMLKNKMNLIDTLCIKQKLIKLIKSYQSPTLETKMG